MLGVFFPLEVTLMHSEDNSSNSTTIFARLKYRIDFLKGDISKHSAQYKEQLHLDALGKELKNSIH